MTGVLKDRPFDAYHEVDRRSTTENVCNRHNSSASVKPFRRARVVEGSSLAVQLHVPRVDTWTEDPWVVEIVLSSLNQEDLEVVVEVGQTSSNNTSTGTTTTHDDIDLEYRNQPLMSLEHMIYIDLPHRGLSSWRIMDIVKL